MNHKRTFEILLEIYCNVLFLQSCKEIYTMSILLQINIFWTNQNSYKKEILKLPLHVKNKWYLILNDKYASKMSHKTIVFMYLNSTT